MKKTKKAPSYTLSNFNIEKALEKKIKDKSALSEIEFNLCSDKQKRQYILNSTGRKLTKYENDWAIENNIDIDALLRAWLLKSGKRLDYQEIKLLSKEEIAEYIKTLEKLGSMGLYSYEKELFTKENYQQYLHKIVDNGDFLPDDDDFELLSDEYRRKYAIKLSNEDDCISYDIFELLDDDVKLNYIAKYGYSSFSKQFENWFNNWKKAYEREQKMDSILK